MSSKYYILKNGNYVTKGNIQDAAMIFGVTIPEDQFDMFVLHDIDGVIGVVEDPSIKDLAMHGLFPYAVRLYYYEHHCTTFMEAREAVQKLIEEEV